MTDSFSANHHNPPLEVEVYLRLSQEDGDYLCEIVSGGDGCIEQVIFDGGREVIVATDAPELTRYTLRQTAGHDGLMALVRAIVERLQRIVSAERVAVLALGSPADQRSAHWLIAPLRGKSGARPSRQNILGMQRLILPFSERGLKLLAGHIRCALAG
jgi:hypothetical protein